MADSSITQESEESNFASTANPLESEQIDNMSINSFLQECKAVKEKYFQDQQVDFITYAMQPTNLDDMVHAEFEEEKNDYTGTLIS